MVDISVVIPSKNGLPLLENQLKALAQQKTTATWEVIVSDNGSTDNTQGYIRDLSENFPVSLIYISSAKFPGAAGARNLGVLKARGDFVAFCDADDEVSDGWVEAIYQSSKSANVIGGPLYSLRDGVRGGRLGRNSIYPLRTQGFGVVSCNFAIKKSLLIEVGGFDMSLPAYGGEDIDLALRLSRVVDSYTCNPQMIVFFRETKNLKSRLVKIFKSNLSEIYIWKKCPNNFPEMNNRVWVLNSFIVSFTIAIGHIKNKNYTASLRYLLKPLSILAYILKGPKKSAQPTYIESMVD
ncbi:glycosyltransferase family 2 protein [Rothia nasimurium]|uniref:glycosyltransferase family 2 protein n=1 Tax=Rothia nasimurium TaxID=85336 RepID=UPI00162A87AA|nr:glycosyltransferase family A protein [Rothia nasimurium]